MSEDEFDDYGMWVGTCATCGTNHDGMPPRTFGADFACLHAQAAALLAPARWFMQRRLARLDRLIATHRDAVLRRWWRS